MLRRIVRKAMKQKSLLERHGLENKEGSSQLGDNWKLFRLLNNATLTQEQ